VKPSYEKAYKHFQENNGILKTHEARQLGISPNTLYALRDEEIIETLTRGVFRLTELPPLSHYNFSIVSLRYPKAVMCLISALDYYELTTQIPNKVYITLPQNCGKPGMKWPRTRAIFRAPNQYEAGITTIRIDGIDIKIYDIEKTIVDCFKFRHLVGADVAFEALKNYIAHHQWNLEKIRKYAIINRVEKLIRPYVEILIA
jgi:predicted transcriptional regulator of viral defense system